MSRVATIFGVVPLNSAGVRLLAGVTLVTTAGLLAALAAADLPSSRSALSIALTIAIGVLALVATVPALLSGRFRFGVSGIPSMMLSLSAATAAGLGLTALGQGLAWLLVIVCILTVVYHGVGADRADTSR